MGNISTNSKPIAPPPNPFAGKQILVSLNLLSPGISYGYEYILFRLFCKTGGIDFEDPVIIVDHTDPLAHRYYWNGEQKLPQEYIDFLTETLSAEITSSEDVNKKGDMIYRWFISHPPLTDFI
jgi:hypothetical protein